jgi:hypothetical protein
MERSQSLTNQPFRVGVAKRSILPTPEMGPVYRAGYKMGAAERLTEAVDEIFLRCLSIETEETRIVFLSLDLIGLLRDFTEELGARLGPHGLTANDLIVASTHVHSGPDTMGLWGPSFGESGYNEKYGEFLFDSSVDAIAEALEASVPAQAYFCFEEKNLGVANFRNPDDLNLDLWCLTFKDGERPIGSLFSYTAQPEFAPRDDESISGDYPGEACRQLERRMGGTALFLLGVCGGMEPEGCEQGYDVAWEYGGMLADELSRMNRKTSPLPVTELSVSTTEVALPVENPGFQLMMERGMIQTSRRPPEAVATISTVRIGDLTLFTIPGESFPGIAIDIGQKGKTLFVNQVNDSLGYFLPAEQFRAEPVEWTEDYHETETSFTERHFTGHELESLGRTAGDVIRRELLKISSDCDSVTPAPS